MRSVDLMMDVITRYGHFAFLIYGIILWMLPGEKRESRRETCVTAFISVCLCSLISLCIGKIWKRKRPFTKDWRIWNFTGHKANSSFPSNHTMNGAAVSVQLLKDGAPGGFCMTFLAGLIAFSRLFAGLHYPTDLLGGAGIAWGVHRIMNRGTPHKIIKHWTKILSFLSDTLFLRMRGR